MRTELGGAAAILLACLLGCGGGDSDPPGLGPARLYPVPGCEALDHRPCDVATAKCQERLMAVASCVRGGDPAPVPPVSVMTEAEYADYVNGLLAEEEPPPVPNHYEAALVMLRLAQPGAFSQATVVAEEVKFIAGIYRNETKDIVLIEHEEKLDDTRNSILLVHEYIHALEDREIDLQAFREEYATTTDSLLAVRSLVEGEARLHESRYAAAAFGLDPSKIDWPKHFDGAIDWTLDELSLEVSVYSPAYRDFAYTFGARYAYLAFEAGGHDGVLERYASPSLTSRTMMASAVEALRDEPAPAPLVAPLPPAEWTPFTEATLGALGVFLLGERATRDRGRALAAAVAWRNDRLFVYQSPNATATAAVWRIELANDVDAGALSQALTNAAFTARQVGARVDVGVPNGVGLDWPDAP